VTEQRMMIEPNYLELSVTRQCELLGLPRSSYYYEPVAVDGVSLTVAAVKENTFTIALIPFTLKHTTLGSLKKGGRVNIEVDVVARYLERLSSRTCLSRSER